MVITDDRQTFITKILLARNLPHLSSSIIKVPRPWRAAAVMVLDDGSDTGTAGRCWASGRCRSCCRRRCAAAQRCRSGSRSARTAHFLRGYASSTAQFLLGHLLLRDSEAKEMKPPLRPEPATASVPLYYFRIHNFSTRSTAHYIATMRLVMGPLHQTQNFIN